MRRLTKQAVLMWLARHPKLKQWLWFLALWCLGLMTVLVLTYPIKLLVNNLR